ncbi:MAG TPA: hypothetical protein VKB88_23875 [Bryobacteraceae bacterium]|nr:hypothetical protein [Bryobacteraceae bacterium]
MPDEEARFVQYLESLESTLVFPAAVFSKPEDIRWLPLVEGFQSDQLRLLITPVRFIDRVRTTWVQGSLGEGYSVDIARSPVLFYSRGNLEDNLLYHTSLSSESTYLPEGGKTIVDQPAEFNRWAKKVMQWVRKEAPLWYQYKAHRLTERAEAARQAGLELK